MEHLAAFRVYKAKPISRYYSSAVAENGDVVVSIWEAVLKFDKTTKTITAEEDISQWTAPAGKNQFVADLRLAQAEGRSIRLIKAEQKRDLDIETLAQTGNIKNSEPLEHLIGEVVHISEDSYKLVFRKE